MPTLRRFDFQLGNRGYLLQRGQYKGRSWIRTGSPDTPSRRSDADTKYGVLPDTLDHPTVWDDWSGGYGHPYRRNGENTYHWGENFDARFPRQLVHAQNPQMLTIGSLRYGVDWLFDSSLITSLPSPPGAGLVCLIGTDIVQRYTPVATASFMVSGYRLHTGGGTGNLGQPALCGGSYALIGNWGSGAEDLWTLPYDGSGGSGTDNGHYTTGLVNAGAQVWRYFDGTDSKRPRFVSCVAAKNDATLTANWAASFSIGNMKDYVKFGIGFEDQVFFGMTNGLYAGDETGTFVNVLSELQHQSSDDNCRDLTVHDGAVIAPHIAGLFSYKPGLYEAPIDDISPPRADRSPVRGHIRAVRSYGRWLYAGLYTGSQSWLLSGERKPQGMVWHTLQKFPHTAKVSRLHVDGITTATAGTKIPNRIWAAMDASIDTSGTSPIYYWPIPMLDGNPLSPSPAFSANYIGSARMDLGNVDWGAPGTPKGYREVEVWADMLLSGYRYCDVYYDLDQSGSFALLGRAQTSPKSVLYFTAGEGSWVTGQSIELSLRSFTASPAYTPIYRSIALRGALLPNSIDQITAVVQIADNLTDRQGGKMRSGATMIKELRDFAAQQTPTTLIDLVGAHSYVSVIPPVEEVETYQKDSDEPEIAATIRLAVLTFS